jgi:hypothetical protein
MSPYTEDMAVCRLAASLGMEVNRRDAIDITDEAAISAAGFTRKTPDYPRIRRAIDDGATVPGAQAGGVEYVLRAKPATPPIERPSLERARCLGVVMECLDRGPQVCIPGVDEVFADGHSFACQEIAAGIIGEGDE